AEAESLILSSGKSSSCENAVAPGEAPAVAAGPIRNSAEPIGLSSLSTRYFAVSALDQGIFPSTGPLSDSVDDPPPQATERSARAAAARARRRMAVSRSAARPARWARRARGAFDPPLPPRPLALPRSVSPSGCARLH